MAQIKNRHQHSPFEGRKGDEYIGNEWGWKFTFWGALFILGMVLFMAYRFHSLGVSPLDENGHVIYQQDTLGF